MEFRTSLPLTTQTLKIGYSNKLLLMGSCFSESIGNWLKEHFFDVTVNPFGVIYNPVSIEYSLRTLLAEKVYREGDLFHQNDSYGSFDFHSRFSGESKQEVLSKMNHSRIEATARLKEADFLLITFGTSWVYTLTESARTVSNCHKFPAKQFTRSRLSVEEIVAQWIPLIEELRILNPKLQLLFTVSPIRHLKESLHGNQLSKATLLLAIDQLQQIDPRIHYFPAYELILDDLRDYRFYAEDMVHPSSVAIKYIQERFIEHYFTHETTQLYHACNKLAKALQHRPTNRTGDSYQLFLMQNILKAEQLMDKNHLLTLSDCIEQLRACLNEFTE